MGPLSKLQKIIQAGEDLMAIAAAAAPGIAADFPKMYRDLFAGNWTQVIGDGTLLIQLVPTEKPLIEKFLDDVEAIAA